MIVYAPTISFESTVSAFGPEMGLGKSHEATLVRDQLKEAYNHYFIPVSRLSVGQRFINLRQQWMREKRTLSSTTEIVLNPNYQKILGMGPVVVPYILESLLESPDYWFHALTSITGENPIHPNDRGDLKAMTATWINWGKANGLITT